MGFLVSPWPRLLISLLFLRETNFSSFTGYSFPIDNCVIQGGGRAWGKEGVM